MGAVVLKIVQVGAGGFANTIHGPMLKRYTEENPGKLELAGICVRTNVEKAREYCNKYGFQCVYTNIDEMIEIEKPDACLVITHVAGTLAAAGRVMELGVPVLMEKPPGKDLSDAKKLVAIAEKSGTPNLVAFNRRFALCTARGIEWASEHGPFERVHAIVTRFGRNDETFASSAAIHAIDFMQMLGDKYFGGLKSARTNRYKSLAGSFNFHFDVSYSSGATGHGDLLPNAGKDGEEYTLYGGNVVIKITIPWFGIEPRAELWKDGKQIGLQEWPLAEGMFAYGIYQELEYFLSAIENGETLEPSVATTLKTVSLAEAIQTGTDWRPDIGTPN